LKSPVVEETSTAVGKAAIATTEKLAIAGAPETKHVNSSRNQNR
jgi:hypothetical protein